MTDQITRFPGRRRIACLFFLFILPACAATPLSKKLPLDHPTRLGITGFKVTAPIRHLSSIEEAPPKNLSPEEEKRLVDKSLHDIEDKASNELIKELEKEHAVEPVLIPEGSLGIPRGEKPTAAQIELVRKGFGVDAVFYGEIPWYGKTRLIYPIVFESLDIAAESVIIGLATDWNEGLILADIGFELVTSTPLWFGGAYVFGWSFRPVTVEGHIISAVDKKEVWHESFDRITSRKELKNYPESERSKKEVQLEVSLNNALSALAKSMSR